jgi:hypothetical protein
MMEKIADIKLTVAVGFGGSGCIVEAIDIGGDINIKADLEEYGGYLDDFFHDGTKPPAEAGIYAFNGSAHGLPWSDEMYRYIGEYIKVEINPVEEGLL